MCAFRLYLYISGETSSSVPNVWNLKRILDERLKGQYSLEVINVLDDLQRTEQDKILASPTLVKLSPPPERRIVGDLSDWEKVRLGLGLNDELKPLVNKD